MKDIRGKGFVFSYNAIAVFLFLLVFQPTNFTFFALRPADFYLLGIFIYQFVTSSHISNQYKGRNLILYFGLINGLIALISTLIQNIFSNTILEPSQFFIFYHFARLSIIYIVIENIVLRNSFESITKLYRLYAIIGLLSVLMAIIEYSMINPFYSIYASIYSSGWNSDNLLPIDFRAHGVMDNPNISAMLLISATAFSIIRTVFRKLFLFHLSIVLVSLYGTLVLFGSRTAIFIFAILLIISLYYHSRARKSTLKFSLSLVLLTITGLIFFTQVLNRFDTQSRIVASFTDFQKIELNYSDIAKWTGRYYLWEDRLREFHKQPNDLKYLIGIGYTGKTADTSDNGFLSAFIYTGTLGLLLKVFLYYNFLILMFSHKNYNSKNEYSLIIFTSGLVGFSLLINEFTGDMLQQLKLGQIFYVFTSVFFVNSSTISNR